MRQFALSALAAGLVVLAGSTGQANDTVRLVDFDRGTDGGTDTQLTHWRGGGFGRGGGWGGGWGRGGGFAFSSPRFSFSYGYGRPYWGGWGGGWNRSYWGGGWGDYYGRPYWGGGWGGYYGRPYWGGGWGSYYYPRYYAPVYYSYPVYYSSYPVYDSYPSYYYSSVSYPVVDQVTVASSATTTLPAPRAVYSQSAPYVQSVQPTAPSTYPYDGGPAVAPPMPGTNQGPNPTSGPRPTVPLEGRLVSLPRDSGGFVSTVETATAHVALRGPADSTSAPVVIDGPAPTRYSYPAYGEQNLPPVTRTRTK